MNFVNVSGKDFCTVAPADYPFWELLDQVVQEEPSESLDPIRLGYYASIGIEKGKPFAPDARMKKILTEAAAVGDATARAVAYRIRQKESFYYESSAWRVPFVGGYRFERQPGVLNLDGYIMYYFAATGVTPAMEEKMVGQGSQYAWAVVDCTGLSPRRRQDVQTAVASQCPGQKLLVRDRVRQPGALHGPDGPAVPQRQQRAEGPRGQRGRIGGHLLWSKGSGGQIKLDSNRARQGLEHHTASLQPARAVVRQDLAARRDRAGQMSSVVAVAMPLKTILLRLAVAFFRVHLVRPAARRAGARAAGPRQCAGRRQFSSSCRRGI